MIRNATIKDIPELLRMGERFFNLSGYADNFSYDTYTTSEMFKTLIDTGCLLTDGKHGMIGFIIFPIFFNKSQFLSQELFWWVDEEQRKTGLGVELLETAEKRATELGAKTMLMLSLDRLDGDRIGQLYEKMGYNKTEQIYSRGL